MNQNNGIWVGTEDLTRSEAFVQAAQNEFSLENIDQTDGQWETSRRDFLKVLGFGLGAATLASGCEIPIKKAVPFVTKPDDIVPGVANYYATTFVNGGDVLPVLVRTREGRPIKIEGNTLSPMTGGGTNPRAQASVLSLYDSRRIWYAGKVAGNEVQPMKWADLDAEVKGKLGAGNIRIIAQTLMSPTGAKALGEFMAKYPNARLVQYDPVSYSAMLDANRQSFGKRAIPNYRFDLADVIVSFGADFLGTWISPVEYARQYAKNRRIRNPKNMRMSRHYQVEAHMSLTGSNADNRILVKPSEQGAAICALYNALAAKTGAPTIGGPALNNDRGSLNAINKVADELIGHRGRSLVVCGTNNTMEHLIVNRINDMLGNLGTTVDVTNWSYQRQGNEQELQRLIQEMAAGQVATAIIWNANPAYDLPNAGQFKEAFAKVGTRVSFNTNLDETTLLCSHAAPMHHYLESWGDVMPKSGQFYLQQPTIAPLFQTRQAEHTLLEWADSANLNRTADQPYYEYLKSNWLTSMKPGQTQYATNDAFWDMALHDGFVALSNATDAIVATLGAVTAEVLDGTSNALNGTLVSQPSNSALEIAFYENINIGNGQYAHNPWLQEVADPVTRVAWSNVLSIPVEWDGVNKIFGWNELEDGQEVDVTVNGSTLRCTVTKTFGQMPGTVAIALGGNREAGGGCSGYGVNVNPWLPLTNGLTQYWAGNVEVSGAKGRDAHFACVQYHHTMGVKAQGKEENAVINADEKSLGYKGFQGALTDRSIIFNANLNELPQLVKEMEEFHAEAGHLNEQTLYPDRSDVYGAGVHWGMYIDLNACIGCGACAVACIAENNVPVVGRNEVARHHEMLWLRIDRYFYGDLENPKVVYQPMMCQHCENAPCENVCPVAATTHSMEGLNQMAYNRCIGTRYCANNCPYKVRRFNWLDYTTADIWPGNTERVLHGTDDNKPFYADNLVRMVLNPDVTVRSRGVIEKCTFCIQRIQEGKLTAKRENRALLDNDVRSACQTACPTGAIIFGNTNNPDSEVNKLRRQSVLTYQVLEEINARPNVEYTAKIRNANEALYS